jgi:hypothetical protein
MHPVIHKIRLLTRGQAWINDHTKLSKSSPSGRQWRSYLAHGAREIVRRELQQLRRNRK